MSRCPSQDWTRYCDDQEMPEVCPVCGKENSTEGGEWICPEHPCFCSKECGEKYAAEQKALADAYYNEERTLEEQVQEHNDKCPQCKGQTRTYCFHPSNPDNRD